jgi:hypothetical protein
MNRAMYVLSAGIVALLFVFSGFSASAQVRLTAVQYWLDDQAMDQSLTQRNVPGTETWDWQKDLDLTGVTAGLHFLHYRFLDTEGRWSSAYSHLFFKTTRPDNEILSMQYWLDDKQPSGIMPYTSTFDLDLSGMATGLHFLHIRYLDKQGGWSSAHTHLFFKTNQQSNDLVSMQYWLDDKQPSGIMPYRPTFDLDLSGVATGLHFLHVRYLDKQGRWSSAHTHLFYKTPGLDNQIVAYRYWFNDDFKNHQVVAVNPPRKTLVVKELLLPNQLPMDVPHLAHYQFQDQSGKWSSAYVSDTFERCKFSLEKITPNRGGNSGFVTCYITGRCLTDSSIVILRDKDGNEVTRDTARLVGRKTLSVNLNLSGKKEGIYDVVVINGRNLVSQELTESFFIETTQKPILSTKIIGRTSVRSGSASTYNIILENEGNIGAWGTILNIAVSNHCSVKIKKPICKMASDILGIDTLISDNNSLVFNGDSVFLTIDDQKINLDSIYKIPFPSKLISLSIPYIGNKNRISVPIEITSNRAFEILAFGYLEINNDTLKFSNKTSSSCYGVDGPCVDGFDKVIHSQFKKELISRVFGFAGKKLARKYAHGVPKDLAKKGGEVIGDLVGDAIYEGNDLRSLLDRVTNCIELYNAITEIQMTCSVVNRETCKSDFVPSPACDPLVDFVYNNWERKESKMNATTFVPVSASFDPNEKVGSRNTAQGHIRGETTLPYTIFFENLSTATAPAYSCTIYDTLDKDKLDLKTFQFGVYGFGKGKNLGDTTMMGAIGVLELDEYIEVNLTKLKVKYVHVRAKLDPATGILTYQFEGLNEAYEKDESDPDFGFLPPNKKSPEGEGFVSYFVKPKENIADGSIIRNRAAIVFDNNPPIITNTWTNTIDKTAPTSTVISCEKTDRDSLYLLKWSGNDGKGSDIRHYSVYFAEKDSAWQIFRPYTSNHQDTIRLIPGKVYCFYSIATDSVYNKEVKEPQQEYCFTATGQDAFLTASGFHLYPNRPNPFHESTTISYELATSCEIHLTVTDLFGKNIATLHSGFQQAGQHDIEWSNRGLSAGIYFYQLSTPFGRLTRKMVITE